jgi:hypothetical protein
MGSLMSNLGSKELENHGADGIYLMPCLSENPFEFDGVAFVKRGRLQHAIIKFQVLLFQNMFRISFNDARLQNLQAPLDLVNLTFMVKESLEKFNGPYGEMILADSLSYSSLYDDPVSSIKFDPDCSLTFKELLGIVQSY